MDNNSIYILELYILFINSQWNVEKERIYFILLLIISQALY